ncbi:MAG: hypothetical protein QQN60_08295 [Nitrosopumilus sp.]
MEYELICDDCGEKTKQKLDKYNPNEEQIYTPTCNHCGKKNQRTFPLASELNDFYKSLRGKARLIFQKYVLEKKSFPQITKDTEIPLTTCYKIYTKEIGMGARSFKQAGKNYWKQKRRNKKERHAKER